MLKDPNAFLNRLMLFQPENVSEDVIENIQKLIDSHPEFEIKSIEKQSKTAKIFAIWVKSICDCYQMKKK